MEEEKKKRKDTRVNRHREGSSVNLEPQALEKLDKLRGETPRKTFIVYMIDYFDRTGYNPNEDNIDLSRIEKIANKLEESKNEISAITEQNNILRTTTANLLQTITTAINDKNLLLPPTEIAMQEIERRTDLEKENNALKEKLANLKKQLSNLKKMINITINEI